MFLSIFIENQIKKVIPKKFSKMHKFVVETFIKSDGTNLFYGTRFFYIGYLIVPKDPHLFKKAKRVEFVAKDSIGCSRYV